MKENRVSNEFRQGREATFAALLMELCLCGERIASIMGIRNWYDQVGTVRIFLCILIFCYYYIIKKGQFRNCPLYCFAQSINCVTRVFSILLSVIICSNLTTS